MKVLLDVSVSSRLRRLLQEQLDGIAVETADFQGWCALRDDELPAIATRHGFTCLLTTRKRMVTEQPHPSSFSAKYA